MGARALAGDAAFCARVGGEELVVCDFDVYADDRRVDRCRTFEPLADPHGVFLARRLVPGPGVHHVSRFHARRDPARVARRIDTVPCLRMLRAHAAAFVEREPQLSPQARGTIAAAPIGSFPIITTRMWRAASPAERARYRAMRHPLIVLFGYLTVFASASAYCRCYAIRSGTGIRRSRYSPTAA